MPRRFRVVVNGKIYEVEVEELGEGSVRVASQPTQAYTPPVPVASAPVAQTQPVPPAPVAQAPAPSPAPSTSAPAGATTVSAPMPGKILKVSVQPGSAVKSGELLLILEAMKMENEILSPASGTVKEVRVKAGDSVNTGDTLVIIA
ncbi:MAG: biotin/lipoyl-binding protein [Synergistota bacterium]|nr:biotin/lipoyl-binding protein [Synergistota bacterium]HHV53234.1 biotin/lipoyl-binding protein [Synergistaceae bacterium]